MIANEQQLRYAIECIAKMYRIGEREAQEPLWDVEMRTEMSADTEATRLNIEREVADYLAQKYAIGGAKATSEGSEKAA